MKEFKIHNISNNEKLVYYIKNAFPNLSTATLYKAIRNKDIKVNGKRITDINYILSENDILQIYIDDYLLYGFPKECYIAYEDDNILVAYKPQGVLSNNEDSNIDEPTFENYIKLKKGENIRICHRLDRNTAGLLIFTKNTQAYNQMLDAFKNGYITKEYIAYVSGTNFEYKNKRYEKYILKDKNTGYSKIYDNYTSGAQKIVTDIFVENTFKKEDYSILRVLIHTGKTHQIRAQLASISHPIIGDSKYGKNDVNRKFKKYKQLLFAVRYSFNFPNNSILYYLNTTDIKLEDKFYKDKV